MRTHRLRRSWLLLLLGLFVGLKAPLAPPAAYADGGDDEDPFGDDGEDTGPTSFTPQQAEKAILKGVNYLRKVQLADGSWGDIVGNQLYGGQAAPGGGGAYTHPAGSTALALYALLKCKVPVKDGSVKRGFDFLRKRHELPGGAYETSAMLLAVCATANPYKTTRASEQHIERLKLTGSYRKWAQDLQEHLLDKRRERTWRYQVKGQEDQAPEGHNNDLSSTQLAALALFACNQVGIKTPAKVWEDILSFSLDQQDDDGPVVVRKDPATGAETRRRSRGFSYIKGASHPEEGKPVGSMTACGIANIMMARFVLTDGGREMDAWNKRPDAQRVQEAVDDGITWLEENWSNWSNPHKSQMNVYHIYWLYSVERAMDLIGRKTLAGHVWYSEMGQQLIDRQNMDEGWWDSGSTHEPTKVLDTCFALLFLKKATQGAIPFPSVTGGSDEPPVDNR